MLHIHNGDSTSDTAKAANIPGKHLAWREALICGPAPHGLTPDQFRELRAAYLSEAFGEDPEWFKRELRAQEEALTTFRDHDELVLWFEHDLFCQVHLIYLLNWFAQHELGKTKLSLICINQFPGFEDFRGLGQLNESQLSSLLPERREITAAQLDLGVRAWAAYTAPGPEALETLIAGDTLALPFLQNALLKHLQRFPSRRNGLGRIENLGLELIASGESEFVSLFQKFGKTEPEYGYGDAQLFLDLKRLATAPEPLLTMSSAAGANTTESAQLLNSAFHITDQGKAVLSGELDFVQTNGIDLWLGGIHLEGKEAAWRWDEEGKKLV